MRLDEFYLEVTEIVCSLRLADTSSSLQELKYNRPIHCPVEFLRFMINSDSELADYSI